MRLEARIIDISSSGRTMLQFSGFKAVAEKPIGGRVGDRFLFAILPREEGTRGRQPAAKPTGNVSPPHGGTPGQNARPGHIRIVLLKSLPRAETRPNGLIRGAPQASKTVAPSASGILPGFYPDALPGQSIQILGAWIKKLQKTLQRSAPTFKHQRSMQPKAESFRESPASKPTASTGRPESKPANRKGAWPVTVDLGRFYLEGQPVKVALNWITAEERENTYRPTINAIFLLELEFVGPVRVDIQMTETQIGVDFFVGSEKCRERLAEALPALRFALAPLVGESRCHVDVSIQKIIDFMQETGGFPPAARFHARV
jgi:hypothetical protein